MRYQTLTKEFYKLNKQDYENLYHSRFDSEETIKLDILIHGNTAFIYQNADVFKLCLDIHKIDKVVLALRKSLPLAAVVQFTKRCLIDEVVLTNSIEGVNSTRKEIGDILDSNESGKRFYGLVQKYKMLQKKPVIELSACEDIRVLYNELVLPEIEADSVPDGKIFRKDSVSVNSISQKEIHRGVMPESEIIHCMDSALTFLNNDNVELLIRVGAFHYLIGYIHPFYDGNGRLSRFISSYMLTKELDYLIGYRLSYTVQENLKKYYDGFKICNDVHNQGDITPFVIVFLEILKESMLQLEEALRKRLAELQWYGEKLDKTEYGCNPKYKDLAYFLIQGSLFAENGISGVELSDMLQISRTTLYKRLDGLRAFGCVDTVTGEGRRTYYKFNLNALE